MAASHSHHLPRQQPVPAPREEEHAIREGRSAQFTLDARGKSEDKQTEGLIKGLRLIFVQTVD